MTIENPTYIRYALVAVVVDHSWLTCEGDEPDEHGGWEELESQMKRGIEGIMARVGGGDRPDVQAIWEEWEGPPTLYQRRR